jgi:hypothetical protein
MRTQHLYFFEQILKLIIFFFYFNKYTPIKKRFAQWQYILLYQSTIHSPFEFEE